MRESRSPPPFNEEPQISKDFWGFFVFLPQIFFFSAVFFFSLNISLSRRFRRWRRFFLIDYLRPTDLHRFFLIDYFSHGFTLIFSGSLLSLPFLLFPCHFFISQILDLSVWEDDADFWFHELEKDYADFSNSLFFLFCIHWFLYIINLLIRHFSDPYFFYQFRFISLFFYQFLLVSLI